MDVTIENPFWDSLNYKQKNHQLWQVLPQERKAKTNKCNTRRILLLRIGGKKDIQKVPER